MGADLSRIRSNPLLDFAGVELKQGGVLLDADFNELVAIVDRRLRAAASDILGRSTVSSTTPDAFKIGVAAGTLTIGRGRLYVDGLLAENHGTGAAAFDALLSEPSFTDAGSYVTQPYLPSPPALPTAGRHLVYLDVWNREVTYCERPALVETAVGVETSSRVQTVWQVRVLAPDAGNASCASPDADLSGWPALAAPSGGRLTTGTFDVPPGADPCELPPSGGYRGLENQTYRVEIHDGGAPGGTATFKWSRENASVCSRVASVVGSGELELQSLGRDEVLRFSTGDWVEIIDDVREFAQQPGEMRQITVNESAQRITFAPALPSDMLPAAFPDAGFPAARHLRVRRWDQRHEVLRTGAGGSTPVFQDLDAAGSTGLIRVPAAGTTLLLENGITVSFDGSSNLRPGDFWVFAARTADASVELLAAAPPRGIHHHYARLGIWDLAAGTVTDCRTGWPPRGEGHDCTCTECVTAETHASGTLTIQAAVDRLQDSGGTVCLGVGTFQLDAPVRLNGTRSLKIRGEGTATLIVAPGGAFTIANGIAVAIEDLCILSLGRATAISVRTAVGLTLQRLVIAVVGNADLRGAAIALSGAAVAVTIRDNAIIAPVAIQALDPQTAGVPTTNLPPAAFLLSAILRIEDNILWCERQAVALSGLALHLMATRIGGNEILGCRLGAVTALGLAGAGASMQIEANSLNVNGPGITAGVDGLRIEGNKLLASRQPNSTVLNGAGIALRTGLDPNGANQCQILANQISGFEEAGIAIGSPAKELIVKLNIVQQCGNGIVAADDARSENVSIENNHIADLGIGRADVSPEVIGVAVLRADAASIVGNSIHRVGLQAAQSLLRAGVATTAVARLRISGNEVADIGPPGAFDNGFGVGVLARSTVQQAEISLNRVDRESQPLFQGGGRFLALWLDEPGANALVSRVGAYAAARVDATTTLVLGARRPFVVRGVAGVDVAGAALVRGTAASVLGNTLGSRGDLPTVQVEVSGDCLFNDNRCELRGTNGKIAVDLGAAATIVNANRVRGGSPSMLLRGNVKAMTVLGNITTGAIDPLNSPWDALNVRA